MNSLQSEPDARGILQLNSCSSNYLVHLKLELKFLCEFSEVNDYDEGHRTSHHIEISQFLESLVTDMSNSKVIHAQLLILNN